MKLSVLDRLACVAGSEWNALAGDDNPFVRHEFLDALERTACADAGTGWLPRHLTVRDNGRLQGALPLYLKNHSYGEYVFDWAWADAYARAGLEYYPKLVAAVPFTPATGPRLLIAPGERQKDVADLLIRGALGLAKEMNASSLHCLFTTAVDTRLLERYGFLRRVGCQFHWSNPGYRDFEDFISTFAAHKRKKIKRERRYVREAGITLEVLTGDSVRPAHWDLFYEFYYSTIRAHYATPYLTPQFFRRLGETMADCIVLVLARQNNAYVAGALNLRGRDTLYGRYWGSRGSFHGLHFETCYYTAIEFCIAQRLRRFEAGAQGEHKLSRGFVPTSTYSAHWLRHPQFNRAITDFLARERNGMEYYMDELNEHTPYKRAAQPPGASAMRRK